MLAALDQAGRLSVPAFFLLACFLAAFRAEKLRDGNGARDYLKRRLARLLAPVLIRIVRKNRLAALTLWSLFFFMTEIFYGVAAYDWSGTSLHVREAFSASLSLFFVWGSYFVAGLWAARERERLPGWLGKSSPRDRSQSISCTAASCCLSSASPALWPSTG